MPRIALITDFGTRDPYVAAVKGVIASRCQASIIDLTHEIAPFDAFEAGWFLRAVWERWPQGTIFVCVVDPGVGTARRILAAEQGGRIFLAPDNGLLSFIGLSEAVSVECDAFFLANGSTTFHGRDRFAPVAAAIASGTALDELGPRATSLQRLDYTPPSYGSTVAAGTIVTIDRFGNAVTDVERARIVAEPLSLSVRGQTIAAMRTSYGPAGVEPFLVVGSLGTIEISISGSSAAALLQLRRGDRVEIVKS